MKKLLLAVGVVSAVVVPTASALSSGPTSQHRRTYLHLYHRVASKFGTRTPGRDILRDGNATGKLVTDSEVVKSIRVLTKMLAPPPVEHLVVPAPPAPQPSLSTTATVPTTTTPVAQPASTTGASGVPACASESGTNYSTGPTNTNPSSGATGRYQITPGTAANYGCNLSTPGGQDACAQTIYANQGASAWVGCGG